MHIIKTVTSSGVAKVVTQSEIRSIIAKRQPSVMDEASLMFATTSLERAKKVKELVGRFYRENPVHNVISAEILPAN